MKDIELVIKIPKKEFGIDIDNKFQDFFSRLKAEIKEHLINNTSLICGAYELETIDMFLEAFKNGTPLPLEQEPKWFPVSERLPDIDEEVLVDDGIDRFVAWWVNDGFDEGWHSFDGSYNSKEPILAWMPLPKPYKAESEE